MIIKTMDRIELYADEEGKLFARKGNDMHEVCTIRDLGANLEQRVPVYLSYYGKEIENEADNV